MKKEKLNLRRADNLTIEELVKVMKHNYETCNTILDDIVDNNIEYAIEYLKDLKGIKFYSYTFGSVFNNDYEADITSVDEFLNNNFNSNNDTFYELLNDLKEDKDNDKLQEELLNMLFNELDSDAILLEYYDWEDIVYYERDMFDNWLNHYEMAVDMDSCTLYDSYDLEELGIDYQELD